MWMRTVRWNCRGYERTFRNFNWWYVRRLHEVRPAKRANSFWGQAKEAKRKINKWEKFSESWLGTRFHNSRTVVVAPGTVSRHLKISRCPRPELKAPDAITIHRLKNPGRLLLKPPIWGQRLAFGPEIAMLFRFLMTIGSKPPPLFQAHIKATMLYMEVLLRAKDQSILRYSYA